MITQEQKQEADKVNDIYYMIIPATEMGDEFTEATKCAIQDRQSVLEELNKIEVEDDVHAIHQLSKRVVSLNNQISYLKSKI